MNTRYLGWLRDPEVTRYLMASRVPQTLETVRAFLAGLQLPPYAIEADGVFVGTIGLRTVDRQSAVAEVGILIGDRSVWRRGVAAQALAQLTALARRMEIRRLWAATCNPACGALFLAAGWVVEGVQPQHVYLDGAYQDHAFYGVTL